MVGRLIVVAMLAAGLLSAQGKGKGGSGGGMGNSESQMPRPRAQTKMDIIADKLKLSKEQKEQVANILNASGESAAPINQQIANGRQLIAQAMVTGQDKGDDYGKLMTAYTAALAQMDTLEATAYGKIYAILKPNQQKNGEQVFADVMAGVFVRAGGGGGGRRKSQ